MPKGFPLAVLIFCAVIALVWLGLSAISAPREIRTEVVIEAPLQEVWDALVDFESYPQWNPFIPHISGRVVVGSRLEVHIAPPGGSRSVFRPRVEEAVPLQRLQWHGRLLVPGLFEGTHRFQLELIGLGKTKLTHSETFTGLLVGPLTESMLARTEQGFLAMNDALKNYCERRRRGFARAPVNDTIAGKAGGALYDVDPAIVSGVDGGGGRLGGAREVGD